mgnify:CR=1 FL=1
MITIKDVAKDAGVSVGTVSNVLNNRKVSAKRREKVEASIEKLGYSVNVAARSMRSPMSGTVGILLPELLNPFYTVLLQELEKELSDKGRRSMICIYGSDGEKEKEFLNFAVKNCLDGVICVTNSRVEDIVCAENGLPGVLIDRRIDGIPCIASDSYQGGYLAAEKLVEKGSRNVLFIQIVPRVRHEVHLRRAGFEDYCKEHGIAYGSIEFSEQQVESIYSSFSEVEAPMIMDILKTYVGGEKQGRSIDGIFAGTDHLAYVISKNLEKMGIRVPEDVQVIGFDGLRVMNRGEYYVSTIRQDISLLAKKSAETLLLMTDGKKVPDHIRIPVEFIDGRTTK